MKKAGFDVDKCLRWAMVGALLLTAANCGGGGGGGGETSVPSPAFITIDSSETSTVCDSVALRGTAFISPDWYHCCSGAATDTGVTVTWTNAASGETGAAYQEVKESFGVIWEHTWSATIPLVLGNNVIKVTAADPSGLSASATAAISKPANSYSISGTLATQEGVGLGYSESGVEVQLTGDKSATVTPLPAPNAGQYGFACLVDGNYTVTPVPKGIGLALAPTFRNVTVAGANVSGQDFQTTAFVVSGIVNSASCPGSIPGSDIVKISDGTNSWSTVPQINGTYSFIVRSGTYTITVSNAFVPCTYSPSSRTVVVNNADLGGIDFVGYI